MTPAGTAVAERAPTLTLPRKRERERTALGVNSERLSDTNLAARQVKTPSPACGGGLGWGSLHAGGVYG